MLPSPGLPEVPEPPRCLTVTPVPGLPALRLGLTLTDELEVPPDALADGLRPEPVLALGLAAVLVLDDTGTFFDDLVVTVTPDRGAEPFDRAFGAVMVEPALALWLDRWRPAVTSVEIARAVTDPTMIRVFFMSVSLRASPVGGCPAQVSAARGLVPR